MSVLKQVENAMKETMHSVLSTKSEQNKVGVRSTELTLVDYPTVDD